MKSPQILNLPSMFVSTNTFPEPRPESVLPEDWSTTISTSAFLLMSKSKIISKPLKASSNDEISVVICSFSFSPFDKKSMNEVSVKPLFSFQGITKVVPSDVLPMTSNVNDFVGPVKFAFPAKYPCP